MERFEYKWVELGTAREGKTPSGIKTWNAVRSLEDILNEFGNEGWELVYYESPDSQAVRFGVLSLPRALFKRVKGGDNREGTRHDL